MSNSDNIDNQEAVKLEACPFCGGEAGCGVWAVDDERAEPEDQEPVLWGINCSCAAGHGPWSSEAEAIAAWNTRPTLEDVASRLRLLARRLADEYGLGVMDDTLAELQEIAALSRTTPAKLDAPDNQEARWQGCTVPPKGWWCSRKEGHDGPCAARAGEPSQDDAERHARAIYSVSLAGEGLSLAEADDGEMLIGRDRAALRAVKAALVYPSRPCTCGECLECDAYGYNQDQIAEADNQEALAGEGVEEDLLTRLGHAYQGMIGLEMMGELNSHSRTWMQSIAEHKRAVSDAIRALSRTPSSPQADEADVERVGEWRCIECKATFACAVEPVRCPIGDCKGRTFANFGTSTMTTRPAGGEEVDDERAT